MSQSEIIAFDHVVVDWSGWFTNMPKVFRIRFSFGGQRSVSIQRKATLQTNAIVAKRCYTLICQDMDRVMNHPVNGYGTYFLLFVA